MTTIQEYPEGTFNWGDLATDDPDAAMKLYGELFGWEFDTLPIPDGGAYTLVNVRTQEVAGLFEPGEEQAGIPPHWNNYIKVDDVDAADCRCTELGVNVMPQGTGSLQADPLSCIG